MQVSLELLQFKQKAAVLEYTYTHVYVRVHVRRRARQYYIIPYTSWRPAAAVFLHHFQ
jgi:hypothetical protein